VEALLPLKKSYVRKLTSRHDYTKVWRLPSSLQRKIGRNPEVDPRPKIASEVLKFAFRATRPPEAAFRRKRTTLIDRRR
jgi:hypothetical protein